MINLHKPSYASAVPMPYLVHGSDASASIVLSSEGIPLRGHTRAEVVSGNRSSPKFYYNFSEEHRGLSYSNWQVLSSDTRVINPMIPNEKVKLVLSDAFNCLFRVRDFLGLQLELATNQISQEAFDARMKSEGFCEQEEYTKAELQLRIRILRQMAPQTNWDIEAISEALNVDLTDIVRVECTGGKTTELETVED